VTTEESELPLGGGTSFRRLCLDVTDVLFESHSSLLLAGSIIG
jgi:hypothetical protein